jgi:hypothetical protein
MNNHCDPRDVSVVLFWGLGEAECIHTGMRLESFEECGMACGRLSPYLGALLLVT